MNVLKINNLGNADFDEADFFDIFPNNDNNHFNGAWSTYPYFRSGTIIVSGIEQGLFILKYTELPSTTRPPLGSPTKAPSPAPTPAGQGYCNYRGCNGEIIGGEWCNVTRERCGEGDCQGTWCFNAPPPSSSAPTPSPSKTPARSPTEEPTTVTDAPTPCVENPSDQFFSNLRTLIQLSQSIKIALGLQHRPTRKSDKYVIQRLILSVV